MKKALITLIISLCTVIPAYAEQQVEDVFNDVQNLESKFFQSSVETGNIEVEIKENAPVEAKIVPQKEKFVKHMPLVKKTRLRIQNVFSKMNARAEEKQRLREEKWAKKDLEKEKKQLEDLDIKYLEYEGETSTEVSNEASPGKKEESTQPTELAGEVREQVTENEMVLDCDEIVTHEITGEVEAVGNPTLTLPLQDVKLTADTMLYNHEANILKAIGNVVITKNGIPMYGDYLQINMNEENILMDNVSTQTATMKIMAKKAESNNDKLILTEGHMFSDESNRIHLMTKMIGPNFGKMLLDEEEEQVFLINKDDSKIKIAASKIEVRAGKDHDIFEAKDAEFYFNGKHRFTLPSITAYTNKDREYFEANYPEFGSLPKVGAFFGPGAVVPLPFGSTLKLIPLMNYKSKFGFGGAAKFKSAFNDTMFMYGSANDTFVLQGRQDLDENLYIQYGANAYMDNWFLGGRMPRYIGELVYEKGTTVKNFLAKDRDLTFKHRASIAYMKDGKWNMHNEHLKSTGKDTTRYRYMAEISQNLFKYRNTKERKVAELNLVMEGSAAVYGTGDTQFIGRIGPNVHTQYKNWMQDLTYFLSGYSDHNPMPVSETYRYGHSMVRIIEAFRLCKYLSVGWRGFINLSDDSPNGKMFQENGFYFSMGPDDLKFTLGYDFMRKRTYFALGVTLDTKDTTVDFDKMIIKNPERLGQSDRKDDNIAFKTPEPEKSKVLKKTKKPQYAEVIDIEDPDRESL